MAVDDSAPVSSDPNVTSTMPGPATSDPNGMGMRPNHIMASGPNPPAANADIPVARHPDILGAWSDGDYLHLRCRRRLGHHDAFGRRTGLSFRLRCRGGG